MKKCRTTGCIFFPCCRVSARVLEYVTRIFKEYNESIGLMGKSSIYNIMVCFAALLLIFLGCSTKSEDEQQSEETQSQIAKNEEPQYPAPENGRLSSGSAEEISTSQNSRESLSTIEDALAHEEPQIREEAVRDLADINHPGITRPFIQALIEDALAHEEPQIREEAVRDLADINHPGITRLLIQALGDTSRDVRTAALEVAVERQDDVRYDVMEEGISSAHDDIKHLVVAELEFSANHKAVDILIEGLKDEDADFREVVNETLDFLIDKEFESHKQALAWWNQNKHNYDSELFRIDEN